jgi:hypothetical protein
VVNCPWAFYSNLGKLSQEYCFSTFIFYLKLLDQATKRLAVDYSLGLSIYKLLPASTLTFVIITDRDTTKRAVDY